ncbi:MAG: hypothetical protein Q8P18_23005 [Pseudomonadota bacterium]|nr:hypothetical protein [Pseudomonadota bacterium]
MGWVFAIIYGGVVAWMVHVWAGRAPPVFHALRDIAVGMVAGAFGFWLFGLRLGLHEPSVLGTASLAGWFWAGLTSLMVSVLIQARGWVRGT